MAVPDEVKQLIIDLRTYLQEKLEPPVYVSDRRLVKAIQLMKASSALLHSTHLSRHGCLTSMPATSPPMGPNELAWNDVVQLGEGVCKS